MLKAFLFQQSHCFFKKKLNVVVTILAIVLAVGMILMTGFLSNQSHEVKDIGLISAGVSIVGLLLFDFGILGVMSGNLLYTNPDVNFYMAGPFTKKFNLLIPILTSIKSAFYIIFILSCQAAVFASIFGFRGRDMLLALAGGLIMNALGNTISQILLAWLHDKEKLRKAIGCVIFAFHIVLFVAVALALKEEAGSFAAIGSLGAPKILGTLGKSLFLKIIPVGGWYTMIINGIYTGSVIDLILGICLMVAVIAFVAIALNSVNFDYYEEAMAGAQKIADMKAAKSAGVEEMAVDTSKIDIKKGSFKRGFGASVFFHKHLLENTRFSKFFFVNRTTVLYKAIAILYALFMMKTNEMNAGLYAGLFMMLFFDITAFAGGKAMLELNRPYFFMIPEKMSIKLMYVVFGSLPEILFNAVLAGFAMGALTYKNLDIRVCLAVAVITIFLDFLSLFVADIFVTLLGTIGKTPLLLVRQFAIIGVLIVVAILTIVIKLVSGLSLATTLFVGAGILLAFTLLAWFLASKLISRKELI